MEGKPKHVRTHRGSEQRSGERPIGAAKGKQPNLPRPCQFTGAFILSWTCDKAFILLNKKTAYHQRNECKRNDIW